ncbi:hypothetical protein BHE74_00014621 [Ensete ventricosum]|nr:hypothetical protein BHE74_00014621 [Ensete ventricosum]
MIPIGGSGNSGYGVGKRVLAMTAKEVAGKKRYKDHQIYDPNRTGSDACCATAEGITWLWKRMVVEAEAGAARAEEEEGGVGVGTGQQREEKEEGSDEGPMSVVVSSRPMVSSCRKQQWPTVTWLQVATSTTNDNGYRLAEEEEGSRKQGK